MRNAGTLFVAVACGIVIGAAYLLVPREVWQDIFDASVIGRVLAWMRGTP